MRNLKVILSYDGAEFSGWQVQPDARTVQGTLASAIGRITGEKVLPQGSGRTDAGVHALAQVMTFVTESSVPTENFVKALNDILPASVRVLEVDGGAGRIFMRGIRRGRKLIAIEFIGKRSARRFWRGMYGTIRIRWRKRRWRGRRLWWWGSTISLRSRRSIRSASGRARAGRCRTRRVFECSENIFVSSWERVGRRIGLYGSRLGISAPHGEESGGHVHSGGQGDIAG